MPVVIDEFSTKSLYLETYRDEQKLGTATGFVIRHEESNYLITNWHVVTARNPYDNQRPLSHTGVADPNSMKVCFHGTTVGTWVRKDIVLIDDDENEQWLEHEQHEQVDVVAIPVTLTEDITIYPIDLNLANIDLMIYPSETVSIIGFPKGLTYAGILPIWKTGNVASDIDVDWDGKPTFLIDATTKAGMSGSPVIAKRVCIYQTSRGNNIGNAVKFLGVYSGREISEDEVEIGFVWKPRVISEIISFNVP